MILFFIPILLFLLYKKGILMTLLYRKAFTMIEVIFVIVIIGILAAVAIPKVAASRDDAEASVCINEVGQLIDEISAEYTKVGYTTFKDETISLMTHTKIFTASDSKGIKIDTNVDTTGIVYLCEGDEIVAIVGQNDNGDYNLSVSVNAGTNPVSQIASEGIIKNVIGGASPKIFKL